jgi:hypothetical protein
MSEPTTASRSASSSRAGSTAGNVDVPGFDPLAIVSMGSGEPGGVCKQRWQGARVTPNVLNDENRCVT